MASSLIKEILVARKVLAAYFASSAVSKLTWIMGRRFFMQPFVELTKGIKNIRGVRANNDTIRMKKIMHRGPFRKNSGLDATRMVADRLAS